MSLFNRDEFRAVWSAMKPDIFTTRVFFDPLAVPLTILFSKIRGITANGVTFSALVPGLIGAWFFSQGAFLWGAAGYYLFFLLDSIDGKLARLLDQADPLGAFYDFVVDRIVIAAMLLGMGWAFKESGCAAEFVAVQLFLIIFFLKDVLDLKWKEAGIPSLPSGNPAAQSPGLLRRLKLHFKPGQLLSCFIMFIAGPLTQAYVLCALLAIACVVFSIGYNVVIPWLHHMKRGAASDD
jgi:phosphatidylglycerophosphate synthase